MTSLVSSTLMRTTWSRPRRSLDSLLPRRKRRRRRKHLPPLKKLPLLRRTREKPRRRRRRRPPSKYHAESYLQLGQANRFSQHQLLAAVEYLMPVLARPLPSSKNIPEIWPVHPGLDVLYCRVI